jgi:Ras-related protein Rab-32
MDQKREFLFKVLVIGELATGKTALVKRYVHSFFSEHYRATVCFSKNIFPDFSIFIS